MQIGRDAFVQSRAGRWCESILISATSFLHQSGFRAYADDLLERMTNPYLGDTVARVTRDIVRKLEIDGRIFGTMQLALDHGIEPRNMAVGALAGLAMLIQQAEQYGLPEDMRFGDWRGLEAAQVSRLLKWLWKGQTCKYSRNLSNASERGGPSGYSARRIGAWAVGKGFWI